MITMIKNSGFSVLLAIAAASIAPTLAQTDAPTAGELAEFESLMENIDFVSLTTCVDPVTFAITDNVMADGDECSCQVVLDYFDQVMSATDGMPPSEGDESLNLSLSAFTDCCSRGAETPNDEYNECFTAKLEEMGGADALGLGGMGGMMAPGEDAQVAQAVPTDTESASGGTDLASLMETIDFVPIMTCVDPITSTINDNEGCSCQVFVDFIDQIMDVMLPEMMNMMGTDGVDEGDALEEINAAVSMFTDCCSQGADTPNDEYNECFLSKVEEMGGADAMGALEGMIMMPGGSDGLDGAGGAETVVGVESDAVSDNEVGGDMSLGETNDESVEASDEDATGEGAAEEANTVETDSAEVLDSGSFVVRPMMLASCLGLLAIWVH